MNAWDFWIETTTPNFFGGPDTVSRALDETLLTELTQGPVTGHADLETAVALARFTHEEFEDHATKGADISQDQSALVMRALLALLTRLGIDRTRFSPPFIDFDTFSKHWRSVGATGSGSWQVRRDLLDGIFNPLHGLLREREARSITSTLATAISPHRVTGWPRVDEEVAEMRKHFEIASSQQDYSNIGNDCVSLLEALSETVYDHARHQRGDDPEPPVQMTKERLTRYIEVELVGSDNAGLRKLARAAIEFAQAVKHRRSTVTRQESGIAADAVILLANLLRRLQL
ncbi:hypothetical protein [Rathayibacter tritici]|uniref:hypothetical protein n=1 Tax=Rathayibacter tritici TaxID=33888 RepID=UPI0011B07643|nr:hypothetical protein [Rathayibacter tritici]